MKNLKTHYGHNGRVELNEISNIFMVQVFWHGEVAQTFGYDNKEDAHEAYADACKRCKSYKQVIFDAYKWVRERTGLSVAAIKAEYSNVRYYFAYEKAVPSNFWMAVADQIQLDDYECTNDI